MDARLVADLDKTYERMHVLRRQAQEEPMLPGQRDAMKANPAGVVLAQEQTHWRGLIRLLGPKQFEEQLRSEFRATEKHIKQLLPMIEEEGAVVRGQRGAYAAHPLTYPLGQQQTHLRGVARLMYAANSDVPVEDAELTSLLD